MDSHSVEGKKIVIAGGGLVGALCACVMGKKGHRVEVYESRRDPRQEQAGMLSHGRSINLALSARGRAALAKAGLEDVVLAKAIPMRGRMIHSNSGSTKTILYDPNTQQCIYSVSRRFLNELLISEAEKCENVSVHFGHKLIDSNVDKGVVTFSRRDDKVDVDVEADLLIGADGAHSVLRQGILKRPMTNFSQNYIDHGYMELCIPPNSKGEHAMEKNYLHIWPRNEFMLIALPNLDGSFTSTLFMPNEKFRELQSAEDVDKFFQIEFPDAITLIGRDLLIKDYLSSRPSNLISVKCNPLNSGKGVLIGDAAHAMVPFFGQGMNAGFEDVSILSDTLDTYKLDHVEKALSRFSSTRVRHAHAICELALYNYLEMRCLVNQSTFIFRRFLDYKLHKYLGFRWTPLYNNVTFSLTPYEDCVEHKKWQDRVIAKAKRVSLISISVVTLVSAVVWRNSIQEGVDQVKDYISQKMISPLTQ